MRTVLQSWKTLALAAIVTAGLGYSVDTEAAATMQDAMCVKTNTGNYFPVVRVSMMVVPDGGETFEIILKDGQGEAGVKSISFERHQVEIDYSLYGEKKDDQQSVDYSKPFFLMTNTGKYFYMKDLPTMESKDGSDKFDIKVGNTTESNVSLVYFFRGSEEDAAELATGINTPKKVVAEEKLSLLTPISEQMTISGCGDASKAIVYALDGKQVADAGVANGATTIYVGQLPAGVYVLRVGNKALKFTKK